MSDETLTAKQLIETADKGMITNFSAQELSGASYDFRAGDTAVRVKPGGRNKNGGDNYEYLSVDKSGKIDLEPGYAYTLFSKETVDLPTDIQGRLSLKFKLAAKKLFYSGGIIDPGYEGRLYFTIFNLSSSIYTVNYKESMVKGEFKRIKNSPSEVTYEGTSYDVLHGGAETIEIEEMLPDNPARSKEIRDWETINAEMDELEDVPEEINDLQNKYHQIDRTLEYLLYAALASIIAGISAGVTIQIWQSLL